MTIDTRALRNTLGCFATGVTVVTALTAARDPIGITVNSFNSVSLDPPLILFSVDRGSSSFAAFHGAMHYVVNVLEEGQRELSQRFAKPVSDKWNGVPYATWSSGAPVLRGCLANLECAREAVHEGGDHIILVGRVIKLTHAEGGRPLLYYRGAYRGLGD
jgi:flavin reductase (DIM6/NTAB) family NADH-FMN oxidoreductase RutF